MRAVVIGASSGYGLGISNVLTSNGWDVIKASRTINGVDVTNPLSIQSFFEKQTDVDAIIYSAGCAIGSETIENGTYENWLTVFMTNVVGLMTVAKYGLPKMKKGTFIHIGSIAYSFSYQGGVDYCASKAAAHSVMKGLREELFGRPIRVVTIEPGLGDTNFQLNRYNGDKQKAAKHFGNIQQLLPNDLGNAVLNILNSPPHVNYDIVVIKPIEQLTHGKLSK